MSDVNECRAANPASCRYHGALIRMQDAEKDGDLNAYMKAREELVEYAAKQRRLSLKRLFNKGEKVVIPDLADTAVFEKTKQAVAVKPALKPRQKPNRDQEDEKRYVELDKNRLEFLQDSAAVPTPMEAYALWLAVWEAQGGEVRRTDSNYATLAYVDANNNRYTGKGKPVTGEDRIEYDDRGWNNWTPTRDPGTKIPEGYGSGAMTLLLLPDVVTQNLLPSRPNDTRRGWEYGHTKVYILRRDPNADYGVVAETNNIRSKPMEYADVRAYRRQKSIPDLINALVNRMPESSKKLQK